MNDDPKALRARYEPKPAKVLKTDRQLCMLRFSPCGKVLAAAGTDGTVRRWDAEALAELPSLTGHGGWVQAIAFHGDKLFAVDSWGSLRCWPFAEKEPKPAWHVAEAHDGWIRGLAVSPDGKHLATCGADQRVRVWSAEDGKKVQELTGHAADVFAVAFHPEGKSLVSGDLSGIVKEWDWSAGKALRSLDAKSLHRVDRLQEVGGARVLGFDRAGATLAVAGTTPKNGGNVQGIPTILLFDWATGKVRNTVKIGNDGDAYVCDLLLHTDGFLMAVTSGNPGVGKLFFQRPADAQPFFLATNLPNSHSLALNPAGTRLAVSATNGGSNGNGRGKDKEYPGNFSPIHVFDLPKPG